MYQIRQLIPYCCLLVLAVITGCDHQPKPSSNKVTITPTSTTLQPPGERDIQPGLDKSPMDMAYYPLEYPKLKMSGSTQPLVARVIFSRPQKNNRPIFGNLIQYGSMWRLGANEATEIEFFRDVTINNKKVLKGRYVIYCIPQPDSWTLVLNSDLYTWGLKIDATKDQYKFTVPVERTGFAYELFSMEFEKADKGAQLSMGWDSLKASLPFTW